MATHDGSDDVSRRTFMRAATGTAAAAGAASAAASAQEGGNESGGGNQSGGGNESEGGNQSGGGNESGGGGGQTWEVVVGPGGDFVFDPAERVVAPGDTVVWTWDSDNHNIAPGSTPDGAEWEGHPEIVNTGSEYEHTFETTGTYEYVCEPHVGQGMEGSVVVQEGGPETGGGSTGPAVPGNALSLAVGTMGAMVSTLALAYFFIKYGGYEDES